MYNTILVPIELSHPDLGRNMLAIARQAGGSQCRIVALYVAADIPPFVAVELPDGMLKTMIASARDEIAPLAAEAGAKYEVRSGHPSQKILEFAEEIGADLIVIASHRPGLQDYFLGSTAARVVRHAQCDVLVKR